MAKLFIFQEQCSTVIIGLILIVNFKAIVINKLT